jgi:uncharacterized membrane protein
MKEDEATRYKNERPARCRKPVLHKVRHKKCNFYGWVAGATAMVLGYFVAEAYVMGFGASVALVEVPANLLQVASGALVGIPITRALRKRIPTPLLSR